MSDYFQFWLRCFLTGWQLGHGICGMLAGVSVVISFVIKFREGENDRVEQWEKRAKEINNTILVICLIIIPIFVAPYLEYRKADKLNPDYNDRMVLWHPPGLAREIPQVCIFPGGHWEELNGKTYVGMPLVLDVYKIRNGKGVTLPITGQFVTVTFKIFNNYLFIDLDIPTGKRPIQIRNGQSVEELPAGWDWNGDSKALEIVDDQDRAIFQEQWIKTNCISLSGAIETEGMILNLGPYQNDSEPLAAFDRRSEVSLLNIFNYPSCKFRGQRINE